MEIRRAFLADLPQLEAISAAVTSAAQWTRQQWLDIFRTQTPARLAWIAEDRNAPDQGQGIGFLVARNLGPEWELENIAVLPAFHRQGVGRALLSALLAQARARQAERILLEVRASNQPAIRLYNSSGFQLLARRGNYYQNPNEDALILVHTLLHQR
jgi:ribosomal-protein-alanine acetyltransferase